MSKKARRSPRTLEVAIGLNRMRIEALVIKDTFLQLGTESYTPLIKVYAQSKGVELSRSDLKRIRLMMNAQVYQGDAALLELCRAAANHHASSKPPSEAP